MVNKEKNVYLLLGIVILLALLASFYLLNRDIRNNINSINNFTSSMIKGDYAASLEVKDNNAISRMSGQLNALNLHTGTLLRDIDNGISSLNSSADNLYVISNKLKEGADNNSELTSNVAKETEKMTENMVSVAAASEQVSTNINMVSASAEEMSATINEMAINSFEVNISLYELQKLAQRLKGVMKKIKLKEAGFDITAVKSAHLRWRIKFESILHGVQSLREEEITNHHECDFGKWYDGPEGQGLRQFPVFTITGQHHEKTHVYARRIVDLIPESCTGYRSEA